MLPIRPIACFVPMLDPDASELFRIEISGRLEEWLQVLHVLS